MKTNNGYTLLDDSQVEYDGGSVRYELIPKRQKKQFIGEHEVVLAQRPIVQDIPIRYNYQNKDGKVIRNWYRHPLQIFKEEAGAFKPVNDKGDYFVRPDAKIQFKDGFLVIDATEAAKIKFMDEHPDNLSNPNSTSSSFLFRKVDVKATQKEAFEKTRLRNKARALMGEFLESQNISNMGQIQGFIVAAGKTYPSTTSGLPHSSVEDYIGAYNALSQYADGYPAECIALLSSFKGDGLTEVITNFIVNAFDANVFIWKNDVTTGGRVAFSQEVVAKENLENDHVFEYRAAKVADRPMEGDTQLGSLAQFYLYLRENWGSKHGEEIKTFVHRNSGDYSEGRKDPLAGDFGTKIRTTKMDEIRLAEYYFKRKQ